MERMLDIILKILVANVGLTGFIIAVSLLVMGLTNLDNPTNTLFISMGVVSFFMMQVLLYRVISQEQQK